jgi:hypothetical protein
MLFYLFTLVAFFSFSASSAEIAAISASISVPIRSGATIGGRARRRQHR